MKLSVFYHKKSKLSIYFIIVKQKRSERVKRKQSLLQDTVIMTAVNLIMRSVSVSFNAYLTSKAGSGGLGLFQLVMTVYSLAVTFSCAGTRLASTRMAVELNRREKYDTGKSVNKFLTYAAFCGCLIGIILYIFSDFIAASWLSSVGASSLLRTLSFSLPFIAMSSVLGGYFTASGMILRYCCIQLAEQGVKILSAVMLLRNAHTSHAVCSAVAVSTVTAEIVSFLLSFFLKSITIESEDKKSAIRLKSFLRIALPDAAGTSIRSVLLTIEHILIPKGFERSGENSSAALSAYGNIHGMAMPLLLYPSAVVSSFSSLLIPELAGKSKKEEISRCVENNLKRTLIFSVLCGVVFALAAPLLSDAVYHSDEAVMYIRILAPLVPIMYTDMVTDGMLKGLDQQVHSMNYNLIDSAMCVLLVVVLLQKYSIKGYIFILYFSEILNFYLSIGRLLKVCEIKVLRGPRSGNARFSRSKKCSIFPRENVFPAYRDRLKRNQDL